MSSTRKTRADCWRALRDHVSPLRSQRRSLPLHAGAGSHQLHRRRGRRHACGLGRVSRGPPHRRQRWQRRRAVPGPQTAKRAGLALGYVQPPHYRRSTFIAIGIVQRPCGSDAAAGCRKHRRGPASSRSAGRSSQFTTGRSCSSPAWSRRRRERADPGLPDVPVRPRTTAHGDARADRRSASIILARGHAVLFNVIQAQRSAAQVIATIPEFVWEPVARHLYLMVKGFKPSPILPGTTGDAEADKRSPALAAALTGSPLPARHSSGTAFGQALSIGKRRLWESCRTPARTHPGRSGTLAQLPIPVAVLSAWESERSRLLCRLTCLARCLEDEPRRRPLVTGV